MRPQIYYDDLVPRVVLAELEDAKVMMSNLSPYRHPQTGTHWSCHGVCRAFNQLTGLDWQVYDGWFVRKGAEHSWLFHKAGPVCNRSGGGWELGHDVVLDMLPVRCAGGPFLVLAGGFDSPWSDAYVERRSAYTQERLRQFNEESLEIVDNIARSGWLPRKLAFSGEPPTYGPTIGRPKEGT